MVIFNTDIMSNKICTVVIADDHPLVQKALRDVIAEIQSMKIIGVASDGAQALHLIGTAKPDIAIVDIDMPLMDGLDVVRSVKKQNLNTRIVLLTFHKEMQLFKKAEALGVSGYLLKEFGLGEIKQCLLAVKNGQFYVSRHIETLLTGKEGNKLISKLTNTELKITALIATGKSSTEIAELLFVTPKTIENHRGNICRKLELHGGHNSLVRWVLENRSLIEN